MENNTVQLKDLHNSAQESVSRTELVTSSYKRKCQIASRCTVATSV